MFKHQLFRTYISVTVNSLISKKAKNKFWVRDYGYDENGSIKYDHNKEIESITYNHLNLPLKVTVTGKGSITYTYDAAGNKLKKVTLENPTSANGSQTTNAAAAPTVPKAYINYILFDEQFRVVKSEFSKVGTAGTVKTHTDLVNKAVTKNGYVYIYVSNERRSPH